MRLHHEWSGGIIQGSELRCRVTQIICRWNRKHRPHHLLRSFLLIFNTLPFLLGGDPFLSLLEYDLVLGLVYQRVKFAIHPPHDIFVFLIDFSGDANRQAPGCLALHDTLSINSLVLFVEVKNVTRGTQL